MAQWPTVHVGNAYYTPDVMRGATIPAGLLEALHNETPGSEPAMSPTNKLHAAYEPISEAELLADGLIEPVSPRPLP